MVVKSAVIDPGTAQAIAAASGAASVLAVLQEWALALLGVPLGVPLAGFAGACYGASYREPRPWPAFWRSVAATTAVSSILAPLAAHASGVDVRYFAPVAALLGWLLEWGAPLLKRHGPRLFLDLWDRLLGRPLTPRAPAADPEATLPPTLPPVTTPPPLPPTPQPGTPGDEAPPRDPAGPGGRA